MTAWPVLLVLLLLLDYLRLSEADSSRKSPDVILSLPTLSAPLLLDVTVGSHTPLEPHIPTNNMPKPAPVMLPTIAQKRKLSPPSTSSASMNSVSISSRLPLRRTAPSDAQQRTCFTASSLTS